MVNPGFVELLRDQQRRDPGAGPPLAMGRTEVAAPEAPAIVTRRRHMVPLAAELVVGDDDERVLAVRAVHDRPDQVDQMEIAPTHAGVARMLILLTHRLDKADGLEGAVLG